ncbi:MAG: hypothetical protein JWP13_473 [Candidatus Saccharibacteria bacterium]|nr:hypothetical protein [Candidatus Saccharibacteria bacterium]
MKHSEMLPSGHWRTGAFIGSMLLKDPNAFSRAMLEEVMLDGPIEHRPMLNRNLCRSIADEAAYVLAPDEGDNPTERRQVFLRGLCWANAVARQITRPQSNPAFIESKDGMPLHPDMRLQSIMTGTYQLCQRFPVAAGVATDCYPHVDPTGTYHRVGHLGVLAGLYLIDNGERAKQRQAEERVRNLEAFQDRREFAEIIKAEEQIRTADDLASFTALALDLTMDPAFDPRTY